MHLRGEDPEGSRDQAGGGGRGGLTPAPSVAVTRPAGPEGEEDRLARLLRGAGFRPTPFPLTRIDPPAEPGPLKAAVRRLLESPPGYDVLLLTSRRAVGPVVEAIEAAASSHPPRVSSNPSRAASGPLRARGVEVWVVGEATGRAAAREGLPPDRIPREYHAEGLLAAAPGWRPLPGLRVLFPRAEEGRDVLCKGLEAAGARVSLVPAYRTLPQPDVAAALCREVRAGRVDAVTLTASSAARALGEAWGSAPWPAAVSVVAIGPPTAAAAHRSGLPAPLVARPHTFEGIVQVLRDLR